MKKTLSFLILLTVGFAWVSAQDVPTLQVAPSDQVIYPDETQILNKTEPKAAVKPAVAPATTAATTTTEATEPAVTTTAPKAVVPSAKPLVGTKPVPAKVAAAKTATVKTESTTHGWFLRWTVPGEEAAVQAWATDLGQPVQVKATGDGLWEVLAGPLDAEDLKAALAGQGGKASLVKR